MAVSLPLAAAGVGLASGAKNLFGGGDQGGANIPQGYRPGNLAGADQMFNGQVAAAPQYNTWAQTIPYYQQGVSQAYGSPYAQQAQDASNTAGQYGQQFGANLFNQGQQFAPYAQQALNNGFDPQGNIYNRTVQQLQDQTRASQSARGIQTSPYGAGLEDKAMSDFNLDWQDRSLGRQQTGARTAEGLAQQGAQLQQQGVQAYQQGGMMPFQAQGQIMQGQQQALQGWGAAGQNTNTQTNTNLDALLRYLGAGNSAQATANAASQNTFNNSRQQGIDFGNSLQGAGTAYKNAGFPSMFSGGSGSWTPPGMGGIGSA